MSKFVNLVFSLYDKENRSTIGSLTLDALLVETNTYEHDVTEYPVEKGAPMNDNIGMRSEKLSIEGLVAGASVAMYDAAGMSRLIEAKEAIKAIYEKQLPISIVTGADVYDHFAMESCTITRKAPLEQLEISATFKKIRIAEPKATDLPPEKVSDKPKKGAKSARGKAGATKQNAGKAVTRPYHPLHQPPAAPKKSIVR